ncbi:MAG: hypothetical protein LN567_01585 [Rickettsia endosymbiont of Graphium doson]|nr:hypothetical protein [Rickettsia endosymbiont of Graphium doson]
MPEIIEVMPSLAQEAFVFLKDLLMDFNTRHNTKSEAKTSIAKITRVMPSLAQETFIFFKKEIINPHTENNIKIEAIGYIKEIIEVAPNLTQEIFIFLKKIINSRIHYNAKSKAIESIAEIIWVMPNLAQEVFIFLKEIIINSNYKYEVKSKAIGCIVEIVRAMPNLTQEIFTFSKAIITNIHPDVDYNINAKAIESLLEIVEEVPSLAQEAFIFLKIVITDSKNDPYIRSIATNNISNIVRAMPNLAEEAVTFLKRVNMTPKNNYNIKSEAIRGIAVIAKIKPTHATFIFLKTAITNPKTYSYFKPIIAESIIGIVKIMPSLAEEAFVFFRLAITSPQIDQNTRSEFTKNIAETIKGMPSLAQQAFTFLREIITTLNTYNIENYAIRSIAKIVEINSSLALKAFTFLKVRVIDEKDKINYAAAISLIEVAESALFDKSSYKPINELLKIIEWAEAKDSYDNHLHTDATFVLNKITNHITQEYAKRKNPNVIKWFNRCFNELPNIAETRVFLKEICKTILKSGVINQLESQFILNCVKNYHFTFTVAVNKDHKKIAGEIIFEDRRYEIFKNDNLEEFATMLLAATDDPLAEQYKTHKPLFQNKELGLKIAASDIMDVNSITNEKAKLSTETPLLSYIRDIKDNAIILLEKRNVFGNHLIYKFNNNFEKVAAIYPAEIDKETIKQIFKEIESKKFIQCFVKSAEYFNFNEWQLVNEEGRDLFKDIMEIIQNEKVELETSNFKLLGTEVNIRLNAHENILKDGGIINKAELNIEVERLKEENPKLYNYCNALFWNTKNILKACGIAKLNFLKIILKKL